MKRRPPRCAVEKRMMLPTVEPATANAAHNQAEEGRSTAIRIRNASKTPATGTPEESRMDNSRIPAGPQATRASVKWRNKFNVNSIRHCPVKILETFIRWLLVVFMPAVAMAQTLVPDEPVTGVERLT